MEIVRNITKRNRTIASNRKIEYIVVHYVGAVSSARANAEYFKSTYRGASAHYFVDENSIYQVVEDKDVAWHCGASYYKDLRCRNSNSIGIEMCCFSNNGEIDVSEKVVERTIEVTKELMKKYNIPVENVLRHYDVTGKSCPKPFVLNSNRWIGFLNKLRANNTNGKFHVGEFVELAVKVKVAYRDGDRLLLDDGNTQFWVHESIVKDGVLKARVQIAYVEGDLCIVEVFGGSKDVSQFWARMENLKKY